MPESFIPPIELQITLDVDNLLEKLQAAKSAIQAFRDSVDTTAIRLPIDIGATEGLAAFKTFIKTVQAYAKAHPIKVPVVFTTPIGPFATTLAEARAAAATAAKATAAKEAAPAEEAPAAGSRGFLGGFLGNVFGSLFGSWGSQGNNLLNALGTMTEKEKKKRGGLLGAIPGFQFGTLGALAGFGPERLLTTGLGTIGAAAAGLLGGGTLLGASAATVGAVGMGTDMAGIGQAAGDIKNTYQALTNLNQAIQVYGKNSYQAQIAQAQLNATLNSFSATARPAVLQTAQLALQFRNLFDRVTGLAEAGGAKIIGGLIKAAEPALPVIGKFAAQNMGIIQKGLNPFEGWMQNKGSQGGLGIFTNLERIFQRNLPYAVQAGTQAFELFAKTVNYVASNFGGKLLPYLAKFFTHVNNSKSAMEKWHHIIRELVNDFFDVWDVVKNLLKVLGTLFEVFQGAGGTVLQILAQILGSLAQWLHTSGKLAAARMFGAHETQLKQIGIILVDLMPILEAAATGFMTLEGAVSAAVVPILKVIVGFVSHLTQMHGALGSITRGFIGFATGTAVAIYAIRRFVSYLDIGKKIEGLKRTITTIKDAFTQLPQAIEQAKNFASQVGNAFSKVRAFMSSFVSAIGNVAQSIGSFVSSAITNVINLAKTWISNIVEMVTSSEMFGPMMFGILAVVVVVAILIITHWKTVKRWAIKIWHFIANLVVRVWHDIYSVFGNYLHTIADIWRTGWQLVVDIFTGRFSQIPKLGKHLLHDFVSVFTDQLEDLGSLVGRMVDVGKQIVEGLVHGLMSGISWIGQAISSIGHSILGGIKKIFGIFSPSREMAKVGNFLMLGLAQGITDGTTHAITAMTGASAQIMGRSRAALTTGAMSMGRTAGGISGGITMNIEAHFTINAPGGEPGAIRRAIGDAATEFSNQVLVSMRAGAGRLY